jgi:hypothetical protein
MTVLATSKPITMTEINNFTVAWFRALDVHTPAKDLTRFLAVNEFELVVPEGTFKKLAGFAEWYERALHLFFDEVHTLKNVQLLSADDESVTVKVVVNWQASTWNAPEPRSKRIIMDAYQTWVLKRSEETDQPQIATYTVDNVEYGEGSARL